MTTILDFTKAQAHIPALLQDYSGMIGVNWAADMVLLRNQLMLVVDVDIMHELTVEALGEFHKVTAAAGSYHDYDHSEMCDWLKVNGPDHPDHQTVRIRLRAQLVLWLCRDRADFIAPSDGLPSGS